MKYMNHPVYHLEMSDFDVDGNITNNKIPIDKPIIVMMQSLKCHHCSIAKPEFQKLADENQGSIFCATVQGDSEFENERDLAKLLMKNSNSRGYPSFLKFVNGKLSDDKYTGDRKVESLRSFVSN
jgi:thiol-disulfide isomerase/thioredoxin